jgi:hypothetical protein
MQSIRLADFDVEDLRARLRKMSDEELRNFGKAARHLRHLLGIYSPHADGHLRRRRFLRLIARFPAAPASSCRRNCRNSAPSTPSPRTMASTTRQSPLQQPRTLAVSRELVAQRGWDLGRLLSFFNLPRRPAFALFQPSRVWQRKYTRLFRRR